MHDAPIRGKRAWTRETIGERDWLLPIPAPVLDELARAIATLRRNPLQTELLVPGDFDLKKTRGFMARVKRVLESGVGFAVLDRLPVDDFSKDELRTIYWLLGSMIARPVAQSYSGTMLYDVTDTGLKKSPKVRADVTNQELDFHTDYSYNRPPVHIGLQVLRTAKSGGRSSVASLDAAHNELRRREPRLLARLYRPFWLNRYGEHAPGLPPAGHHAVYAIDEKRGLWARFNPRNIYAGHELMDEPLDDEGREAVQALHVILSDPGSHVSFDFAPGQTLFLNNGRCAHRRTDYTDWPEPERKRHLIRIFLRDDGARTYDG